MANASFGGDLSGGFSRAVWAARRAAFCVPVLIALAVPALAQNPIVTENQLPGAPSSQWQITGAGDLSIQGFATDISVNKGQTVRFKIDTPASAYTINIYRMGYYQGNGARLVGTGVVTATLPQNQPNPLTNSATGLVDCGNWAESARWDVPATAVSGIYFAKLTRTDNQGASHVFFVVRDDSSRSDLLTQTSDATWQAYNVYGGNSLYVGNTSLPAGHAAKVSYNRPFITRNGGGGGGASEDWVFNAEYPMVRWLERNGYDVTYTTDLDSDRRGSLIRRHKAFLSVGHDEYWSAGQRANVTAARDAGVHLAFFSGNEIYWKTRWENSIDASNTPYRTLVCYKEGTLGENVCGGKCDPLANTWTGLWRDGCSFTPPADGCNPENALSGQISWYDVSAAIQVPSTFKNLRFWRNTSVASLGNGQTATLTASSLGYEWDFEQYPNTYPPARIVMSSTTVNGKVHQLSLYRHASGALVFGAGTVQWSWGLDNNHDRGNPATSTAMQQATVNLFADMGAQPATLQSGLVAATASSDVTPPATTIASPANGATVSPGSNVTISGTASDVGGTLVGVDVSVDGGATWQRANGTSSWTYAWVPSTSGTVVIKSRGFDDSGNLQSAGNPPAANSISVTVSGTSSCPCTAFLPSDTPTDAAVTDGQPIETGVKFRATSSGYVTGIRFYKGSLNTGAHVGHIWSATGTMLAEATFTGESASGWQEVTLASPISITAGVTYVASYHSTGYYAANGAYFTSAVVRGPLRLLADGEDGANGVYDYGAIRFPISSFNKTNYWVDVVFNTSIGPDSTPPTVVSTSPATNATGVATNTAVTATFNEAMAPASITTSTFVLRNPSLATVAATVSYNTSSRTATLTPNAALAYSTTYTATVDGGTSGARVTDVAGNALASDYVWSFTTTSPPPPPPTEGPGGPILVISSTSNAFSRYPVEILRAEGLNLFAALNIGSVNATTLNGYDVAVLGEQTLTSAQVTMFTNWVNAGGTLIALRPSKNLASLLGLTDASATLVDKYLRVNTASAEGAGIVGETIQYHGTADRYTLNGATAVATLYSNATTATANPAVTTRTVGTNGGRAIAFTYDLARSIVYTRQGNPAWAGQERDGTAPRRSDDMYYGNASGDPQPDWVDLNKVAIPQADEQQRLLANLVLQGNLHRKPLPRFWYFPQGKKAVVVMTGDDHGDTGMAPRFDIYRDQSSGNCSVDDWECVRATGYEYVGSGFTNAQAQFYNSLGFEVAVHILTNCADFTPASLDAAITNQLSTFTSTFPSIPVPTTNRTHCIAWSDWSSEAEVELAHGIRLDTNYYYWPPGWVQDRPGVFTGSGMPMRFAKQDGTLIDCYQVTTQMTDESGQSYPMTSDSLLERALDGRGYYGAFCANMHFDSWPHAGSDAIVQSAQARGVPVVSSKQMLTWLDGRNGSSFGGVSWGSNALSFSIAVATGARNLQAMLPMLAATGTLSSLTRGGSVVTFTTETIKGIEYAFFSAAPGNYVASYISDTTPPSISGVTGTPNANGTATINWTTNEASTSRVDYGTSAGSLTSNVSNPTLVTSHTMTLTGLTSSTTYFYRVTSADASNNSVTSPNPPASPLSFTTTGNTPPVAAASAVPTSGGAPLLVNFSGATSTDANGDSLTFSWAFGDGGTATGRLTSHSYAAAGGYAAILTVNDGRGGTDTASVAISVTAPPAGFPTTAVLDNFNRADGAIGPNWIDDTNRFSIASNTLAPGNPYGYTEWNGASFGPNQEAFVTLSTVGAGSAEHNLMLKTQGSTWSAGHLQVTYLRSASQLVVYTFTPPNAWTSRGTINGVTFAAGDQFGARALNDGTVQAYKNGTLIGTVSVAGWAYAAAGGRIGLSFDNASTSRFDNFGGGNVTAGPNTPPVAAATGVPQTGAAPLLVSFSGANSTDANGDSLTFAWVFGDGGTATGRLTSHTYAAAGNYAAILTVNDGRGGTDTASVAITVTPAPPGNTPPVAAAAGVPTSGTAPLLVNFSGATSTDANGDSLTFAWVFGDGGTATGRLTSHSYAAAGSYAAILTVNDGRGGTDTASVAISVSPPATGFPQTAILDNFNRANGAIGANWIDETTRFSIASNSLAPGTPYGYTEWDGASFGPNQEAFVTLSTLGAASAEHNLMLKTQGSTWSAGHLQVTYLHSGSQIIVYTFTPPSTWTSRGTINGVTFAAGNQLGARALSDGTVQAYKNGTLIGTVSVAGWAYAAAGGRIGLSFDNASTSRFDDFGGGNVVSALAQSNPSLPLAQRVSLPQALSLSAAYPNPTTGAVMISLSLPQDENVSLSVLDIQGREVWRTSVEHYTAGRWTVSWDGRSSHGPVNIGVYLARIHVGEKVFLRRFAVVR